MVELLIVIAVLGILAVAVLSAINPIEQMDRSRDTGSRSDAEQLISAIDRFYTSNGYYPWQAGADDYTNANAMNTPTLTSIRDAAFTPSLAKLEGETSELKSSFTNRVLKPEYNTLYIYNEGGQGKSTYSCFIPKSASFNLEAAKRCGTAGAGLPDDLQDAAGTVCATGARAYTCLP